jgi:outer membrane immunogenic protein
MATARVRVGMVAGPGVLYVTGGVAAGNIKADVGRFPGATTTRVGVVGGGGYEVPLGNLWRGKVEVLHAELGSGECTPAECGGIASIPFNATMVRFGLNLRLF